MINIWTESEIGYLKNQWRKKTPVNEIAKILRRSKNSVIGKASRLGLERRAKPTAQYRVTVRKRIEAEKPRVAGKTMADLKPNECRWPSGDMPDLVFCGDKCVQGRSYCTKHLEMAYRPKILKTMYKN